MIYYKTDKKNYKNQIEYIFDIFSNILGINFVEINDISDLTQKDILINYSNKKPETKCNIINIIPSNFFGKNYLKIESMPKTPLDKYNNLPIIYQGGNKIKRHIHKSKNLIETDIDIIASSFFMITRYEEVILKNKDKFGRFPATASLAYKEKFLDRPIVNEYIELLWSWANKFNTKIERKKSWREKKFTVAITHDIDEIKKYRRPPIFTIIKFLKEKNVKRAKNVLADYIKVKLGLKKDPYLKTFDYIINLEKEYGFNSSFYFMTSGERYSLLDVNLKKIFEKLKKENFEIGIHPSFNAYNNPDIIKKEKENLEKIVDSKIVGGRQHYLKWEIPKSWEAWRRAGLKYDTTLCYADHEGFRCGTCYPFKPFDIIKNETIDIWEIPLIVMDGTLIDYKKLSPDKALMVMTNLLNQVKKYNGIFVLLWHNSYMTNLFTPKWKRCFENFYKIISEKNCLVSSVKKILSSWENEQQNY